MKAGDQVTWTSMSQGFSKTKTGTVILVVPDEQNPLRALRDAGIDINTFTVPGAGLGGGRAGESYLVSVPAKTARGRPTLYWPRVQWLKPVTP